MAALNAVGRQIAAATSLDIVGALQTNKEMLQGIVLTIVSAITTGKITPQTMADLREALANPTTNWGRASFAIVMYQLVEFGITKIPSFFKLIAHGVSPCLA